MTLRDQLIGAWTLVSNVNTEADGTAKDAYGKDPKGLMVFSDDGYVSAIQMRSDLPRIVSGKRDKGTLEEYKDIASGSNAGFGTFVVSGSIVDVKIHASTFPNWNGETVSRRVEIVNNEMTWLVPNPTIGVGRP